MSVVCACRIGPYRTMGSTGEARSVATSLQRNGTQYVPKCVVPRLHWTARWATVTRVAVGDCVACRQWFGYYVPYITHYAALAESLKVERFSVGLELVDASGQSSHWRDVVQNVRKAYNGPLVYGTAL